jgi:hypothetical protein
MAHLALFGPILVKKKKTAPSDSCLEQGREQGCGGGWTSEKNFLLGLAFGAREGGRMWR